VAADDFRVQIAVLRAERVSMGRLPDQVRAVHMSNRDRKRNRRASAPDKATWAMVVNAIANVARLWVELMRH
jgi:hypothetical protein